MDCSDNYPFLEEMDKIKNEYSRIQCVYMLLGALILLATVVLTIHSCSASSTDHFPSVQIRADIENYLDETGVPSVAVAVAKDGKIIWEQGFGWADKENRLKATAHTMYQIGSITKNLTATAMMVLVERGLVDLDAPANQYLSDNKLQGCWCDPSEATVSRLLMHTAGLQDYWNSYYSHEEEKKIDTDEAIRRHGVLVYTPGQKYQYSSLGYGVAGHIIECVSGKAYAEFVKEEICEPLGLKEIVVRAESEPGEKMAQKYDREGKVCPTWLPNFSSSGFIYSSAHDLVRYGMFHLKNHLADQKPIISDSAINLMKTAFDPKRPGGTNYAFGWGVYHMSGFRVASHGGGGPGIDAELVLIPSENVVIVVLANSRAGRSSNICKIIAKEILPVANLGDLWRGFMSIFDVKEGAEHVPISSFVGEWVGDIITYNGNIPIHLSVGEDGSAKVGRSQKDTDVAQWISTVQGARVKDGFLDLWFNDGIIALDADRPEDYMRLIVRREGDVLRGSASAGCDILGPGRSIFYLPFCVELARTE